MELKDKKLCAVNDRIVVELLDRPDKSKGGIVLPIGMDQRKYNEGKVSSVGPDVKSCKPGDEVIWEVYKGQAAGHFDEKRWIIKDEEVLAVVVPG